MQSRPRVGAGGRSYKIRQAKCSREGGAAANATRAARREVDLERRIADGASPARVAEARAKREAPEALQKKAPDGLKSQDAELKLLPAKPREASTAAWPRNLLGS
jgi:hypothetical protein